jgi:hypothetical protein
MVGLRLLAVVSIGVALSVPAGATPCALHVSGLPAASVAVASGVSAAGSDSSLTAGDDSADFDRLLELDSPDDSQTTASGGAANQKANVQPAPDPDVPVDANGNPIPIERQEPKRILGFMPNFRTVSGGAKPHPPGWKYNFTVATHQATDYSSFIFLGLTSLMAEGINEHPALGKGASGFYAYTWRGFIDKTDNTYLSAWLLASTFHEDTRYYAFGAGHSIPIRVLYVISRQAVAKTYGGHDTPNIAGLGAKVLAQVVSRYYYPPSATTFPVLAEKFGYSVMRDVIFSSIREFYPDAAAHFIRRHREKMAAKAAAQDAAAQGTSPVTKP